MAGKRNPAHEWDAGPWLVARIEVEGETANLHVREGLLAQVPDIAKLATYAPFRPLANDEPLAGFVMVAPRKTTTGQYVKVRPVRPADEADRSA